MTTYYVDQNHPSASDSNAGTSESLPWLTIGKACSTLVAGDTCYIKNGTYTEQVKPANSGSSGNLITFEAYTGHAPVMNYASGMSIHHGWGAGQGESYIKWKGITVTGSSSHGIQVAGGSHHIYLEDMVSYGNQASGLEVSGVDGQYTYSVYVDGGSYYNNGQQGHPNGGHGIIFYLAGSYGHIRNVSAYNNGTGTAGQWSSGVEVCGPYRSGTAVTSVDIEYNDCYANDLHGIDNCGYTTSIRIKYNTSHDNDTLGIAIDNGPQGTECAYNLVWGNNYASATSWGGGIYMYTPDPTNYTDTADIEIYNNVVYDNGNNTGTHCGIGFEDQYQDDCLIKNNIMWGNAPYNLMISDAGNVLDSDYNCIEDDIRYLGTNYSTLAAYQSASSLDGNSIDDDPLFVNAAGDDFNLRGDSPAIDAGTDLGYIQDFDDKPVPIGAAPDIGAYEHKRAPIIVGSYLEA